MVKEDPTRIVIGTYEDGTIKLTKGVWWTDRYSHKGCFFYYTNNKIVKLDIYKPYKSDTQSLKLYRYFRKIFK